MGLKYQSNGGKRNFVKELKRQEAIKSLREQEVIKKFRRVIQDRKNHFNQTEERWRKNSRRILADIKETKSKMKEKMEEVIEVNKLWF